MFSFLSTVPEISVADKAKSIPFAHFFDDFSVLTVTISEWFYNRLKLVL